MGKFWGIIQQVIDSTRVFTYLNSDQIEEQNFSNSRFGDRGYAWIGYEHDRL